jgi:hypothetical protein
MVELIEYFNQSGFTDLIRIFLIIGGFFFFDRIFTCDVVLY